MSLAQQKLSCHVWTLTAAADSNGDSNSSSQRLTAATGDSA
jgi:hypothetical protein